MRKIKHKNKKIIIVRNKNIEKLNKQKEYLPEIEDVAHEEIKQEEKEQEREEIKEESRESFIQQYVLAEDDKIMMNKRVENYIKRKEAEKAELERKQDYLNAMYKLAQKEQEER